MEARVAVRCEEEESTRFHVLEWLKPLEFSPLGKFAAAPEKNGFYVHSDVSQFYVILKSTRDHSFKEFLQNAEC